MDGGKYVHTRAYLTAFSQEHGALPLVFNEGDDSSGGDNEDGSLGTTDHSSAKIHPTTVKKVVRLLEDEDEDALKRFLRQTFSIEDLDPTQVEQIVLELMHKHKDDVQGVPFLFLTPTKRPLSRPSSRASSHSYRIGSRPDTPLVSALRRPHTPISSPLSTALHAFALPRANSPDSSPTIAYAPTPFNPIPHLTSSQPSSPLSSPHFLNAKAAEFRPAPRPQSATSASIPPGRTDTPPPDMWTPSTSHTLPVGSPRKGPSNLAIASPLVAEGGYYPRPNSSLVRSNSARSQSGLRRSSALGDTDGLQHQGKDGGLPQEDAPVLELSSSFRGLMGTEERPPSSAPIAQEFNFQNPYLGQFSMDQRDSAIPHYQYVDDVQALGEDPELERDSYAEGMTPFDVLSSVFGSTVAPARLEEALTQNGYEFDKAMAWLVDSHQGTSPNSGLGPDIRSPAIQIQSGGGRVIAVDSLPWTGQGATGGRAANALINTRPAVATGGRVCRYFLAGECRRSDCRFSHDIEKALCRFWLRGQCAKGELCEFLHTLPQEVDISGLATTYTPTNSGSQAEKSPAVDDFPLLGLTSPTGSETMRSSTASRAVDPARTRFAAAVKKPSLPVPISERPPNAGNPKPASMMSRSHRSMLATPRPSPRLKLRPPSLLPTLVTGESVNQLYLKYRSNAIRLGAARNAALTRAAEAWRRGDGAGAKSFSREAHEMNTNMAAEAAEAASNLVRERAKGATTAVRSRDPNWSDDPQDRSTRGKPAGTGFGVLMGVASVSLGGLNSSGHLLSAEERTECLLDLHGLHSNEAVDVLEGFLVALEKEHFLGLAYLVVGEEKHTGTQDAGRGTSKARLAAGVKDWLHQWQYPWNERHGIICVDPLTHAH